MSRWWRAYEDAVDHPKLLLLTDKQHRAWFNLLCVASAYGGVLPDMKVVAVKLRMTPAKAEALVAELRSAELIDEVDGKLQPHDWTGRQFKSDGDPSNAGRQKRYRDRHRNGKSNDDSNVTRNVTITAPRDRVQKTETEEERTELRSGADAPRDVRADLFGKGLQTLAKITGKTPDSCRSLVGKWLKSVSDEAIHVLGAIEDAERNRVADPVAWINSSLNSHGVSNGKRGHSLAAAGADLIARAESFERETGLVAGVDAKPGGPAGHAARR